MNCKYCQQELSQLGNSCIDNVSFVHLRCHYCGTGYDYSLAEPQQPLLTRHVFFAIQVKGKSYTVTCYHQDKLTFIGFYTYYQDEVGVKNGNWQQIHTFNFIVDWTPFNVKEKLERFLIFM